MTASKMQDEMTGGPQAESERDPAGRWAEGCSGNPAGRPKGARNRRTIAVGTALAEKHAALSDAIARQALEEGNSAAARVMLDLIDTAEEHAALDDLGGLPTDTRQAVEALAAQVTALAVSGAIRPATAIRLLDVLGKSAALLPKQPHR